jgi:Alginate lyase
LAVQGPWPGGINQCGPSSNPNNGCQAADNDSNAAYVQALLWYMTGNQAYASNAIAIMNAYAQNFRGYAGTNGLS